MRVGLVEDDAQVRGWLKATLEGDYEVLEASSLAEIRRIIDLKPDFWLLDISLGPHSVFDGLINDLSAPIVFVTGSREHALRAFDLGAADYVTKPIKKERLFLAIERAKNNLKSEARPKSNDVHFRQFLKVNDLGERVWIPVQQVDWIEGADYCCQVHVGSKTWVVQESLISLENDLDPRYFLRVHRSAIIQISQIHRVIDESFGSMKVLLHSGQKVDVSRRRKKEVKDRLNQLASTSGL